ncbi:MAG: DUF1217 domain-containing protein [Alphaproteobacteria bacterium]|nr:DUF1217 domain-containing protein [Alphaproteobacteria bacterium]
MLGVQSSLVQFKLVNRQFDRQMQTFERLPQVRRDLEYFESKAPSIKSVDELLKDRRLTEFVLKGFQLEERVDAKGFIRKVLTEDTEDPKALVNRLNDPRFRQLAKALQGLSEGKAIFADPDARAAMVKAYKTNEFEKYQGEQAPGLREALYFRREIGKMENIFQVIASKPLATVVRVALGLPEEFATLPAAQQKRFLDGRFDLEKLKDPKFLDRFLDRFLANNDLRNNNAGSPYAMLFSPGPGLGVNLGPQGLII